MDLVTRTRLIVAAFVALMAALLLILIWWLFVEHAPRSQATCPVPIVNVFVQSCGCDNPRPKVAKRGVITGPKRTLLPEPQLVAPCPQFPPAAPQVPDEGAAPKGPDSRSGLLDLPTIPPSSPVTPPAGPTGGVVGGGGGTRPTRSVPELGSLSALAIGLTMILGGKL